MWTPYLRIQEFVKKYENSQFHIPAFLRPETEKTEKVDADIRLWFKVKKSLEELKPDVERRADVEAKKERKKQKDIREKILKKNREKYGFDTRSKMNGMWIYRAEFKAKGQFKIIRFLIKCLFLAKIVTIKSTKF